MWRGFAGLGGKGLKRIDGQIDTVNPIPPRRSDAMLFVHFQNYNFQLWICAIKISQVCPCQTGIWNGVKEEQNGSWGGGGGEYQITLVNDQITFSAISVIVFPIRYSTSYAGMSKNMSL